MVEERMLVETSFIRDVIVALEHGIDRLDKAHAAGVDVNSRMFKDLRQQGQYILGHGNEDHREEYIDKRMKMLKEQLDKGVRLLRKGEHILEDDEMYTFDADVGYLTWVPVTVGLGLGRKWNKHDYMPVRRKPQVAEAVA